MKVLSIVKYYITYSKIIARFIREHFTKNKSIYQYLLFIVTRCRPAAHKCAALLYPGDDVIQNIKSLH